MTTYNLPPFVGPGYVPLYHDRGPWPCGGLAVYADERAHTSVNVPWRPGELVYPDATPIRVHGIPAAIVCGCGHYVCLCTPDVVHTDYGVSSTGPAVPPV